MSIDIPLLNNIRTFIVKPFIALLFVVAMFYFFWGIIEYIQGSADPAKRSDGAQHMLYGLIGIFIMASVAGILQVVCGTVGCV